MVNTTGTAALPSGWEDVFWDAVRNRDWTMPPCDRSLKPTKNCEDPEMLAILSKTRYVPFAEFHDKLRAIVTKTLEDVPKFNLLFMDVSRFGSEHWIAALLQNVLEDRCVAFVTPARPIANEHPIVRIDDCMYTGNNAAGNWDDMSYRKPPIKNRCMNIVPFAVRGSDREQKTILKQIETHVGEFVEPWFSPDAFDGYYEKYGCQSDLVSPIYFDHKIAVAHCTFQFLHDWVKRPPSRAYVSMVGDVIAEALNERARAIGSESAPKRQDE